MKWGEITELHLSRFVLVEAIKARSNDRVRRLEDMAVIQDYDDPQKAWSGYKHLHKLQPTRELYVFHTSRSDVEVVDEFFSGGILGIDFMIEAKCKVDFETMKIKLAD